MKFEIISYSKNMSNQYKSHEIICKKTISKILGKKL